MSLVLLLNINDRPLQLPRIHRVIGTRLLFLLIAIVVGRVLPELRRTTLAPATQASVELSTETEVSATLVPLTCAAHALPLYLRMVPPAPTAQIAVELKPWTSLRFRVVVEACTAQVEPFHLMMTPALPTA